MKNSTEKSSWLPATHSTERCRIASNKFNEIILGAVTFFGRKYSTENSFYWAVMWRVDDAKESWWPKNWHQQWVSLRDWCVTLARKQLISSKVSSEQPSFSEFICCASQTFNAPITWAFEIHAFIFLVQSVWTLVYSLFFLSTKQNKRIEYP